MDNKTSVEQYLKMQCEEQLKSLREHTNKRIKEFEEESQRIRENLIQQALKFQDKENNIRN